jgi:hypothetical protein
MTTQLTWLGPYRLCGNSEPVLFDCDAGAQHGLYLWGVTHRDGFLANYVGETGRSFKQRHLEHVQWWLSGFYPVYDADLFRQGVRRCVWEGIGDSSAPGKLSGLISNHTAAAVNIGKFLSALQIMIAPFDGDKATRHYVEGAVYRTLKSCDRPLVRDFLDASSRYWCRPPTELPVVFTISPHGAIQGLSNELSV